MKTLSIRHPWAWLIVNGHKTIENRTWRTSIRGDILIHAGKALDPDFDWLRSELAKVNILIPSKDRLDFGGIVGKATITDCVAKTDDPWFSGPYGFVLSNAEPVPFTPAKGRLGFFECVLPTIQSPSIQHRT